MIIHDYIFWQHRRSQFIAACSNEDRGDSPAKKRFQGKDSRFPDQYRSRNSQEVPIVLVGNKVDLGSEAREVVAKNIFRFICPRTGQNLIWAQRRFGTWKTTLIFCQKLIINVNKFGPHSNWIPQYQNFALRNFFCIFCLIAKRPAPSPPKAPVHLIILKGSHWRCSGLGWRGIQR